MIRADFRARVSRYAQKWCVREDESRETETSIITFGMRGADHVVLKIVKIEDDEWHAGEVIAAFRGNGMVRVLEWEPGAMLLERIWPGHDLARLSLDGRDDEASEILAELMGRMTAPSVPDTTPTLDRHLEAFDWYAKSGDVQIAPRMFRNARAEFSALLTSQRATRLLHGDLHHYNVLYDERRGWLAIDPKGLVGELEYETGAILRNPCERPGLVADEATIDRRVDIFSRNLGLDPERVRRWAFAQAVLAAIWEVREGARLDPGNAWLALAAALSGRAIC